MSTNDRTCGDCSACCHTHSVHMDGVRTPAFEDCVHMCPGGGCAIYEKRPTSCRDYECLWRSSPSWHDALRPDRWGIIVDTWPLPGETISCLVLWEAIPGRLDETSTQAFLEDIFKSVKCIAILQRADRSTEIRFAPGTDDAEQERLVTVVTNKLNARSIYEKEG